MALKLQTLKNNKGQALTETIFMLGLTGVFLFFLLRCLLTVIFTVALDSMVEDYFYCELAQKPSCLQRLESRLQSNQLRVVNVKAQKTQTKIVLTVSAAHLTSMSVTREFNYEKFRQKF